MTIRTHRHRAVALTAVVALILGTGAAPVGGQTSGDWRDDLIARQETLIAQQEALIVAQESLLNAYRCRFDIDTQMVPDGCPDPTPTPPEDPPTDTPDPPEDTPDPPEDTPDPPEDTPDPPEDTPTDTPTPPEDPPMNTPIPPEGTTEAQWEHLRQCESGGNYRAHNPAGPYLGAYQFLQSTWDGVAGRHYPHLVGVDPRDAAPLDQDRMAYGLYTERGWQPWPACGAPFRSS